MSISDIGRKYASIALVDIAYLFKRNFVTNPDGPPRAAAELTIKELQAIRESVGHIVVCLDSRPYNRAKIFPAYKAKRPEPLPQELAQRRWLFKEITRLGYNTARAEGYEADDIIATLCRIYSEFCADIRVYTCDKDAAQLVNDWVIQYIPATSRTKEERRDRLKVKVKFGVYPEQMPLYQALMGDTSDGIPGIPGIGEKKAAQLVSEHKTLTGLATALGEGGQKGAMWTSLAEHWSDLKLYLDLVTLDTHAPIDAEALLIKPVIGLQEPNESSLDVGLDGFMGNETPPPQSEASGPACDHCGGEVMLTADGHRRECSVCGEPEKTAPASERQPLIGKDPNADAFLRQQAAERNADRAAREQQEQERRREHEEQERLKDVLQQKAQQQRPPVTEAEFTQAPAQRAPQPAKPPPTASPAQPQQPGLARTTPKYGRVTEELQPVDLESARTVTQWLHDGGLYPQFLGPATIFAVVARGKEMGLKMATALSAFHVIEGKLSASADLIRTLAERDENCEYFYCKETTATKATWVTKHKKHPEPREYTYTIEEAQQAGLVGYTKGGQPNNWMKRPRNMLAKTAGAMLARLVYPGACLGLYCPEELNQDSQKEEAA